MKFLANAVRINMNVKERCAEGEIGVETAFVTLTDIFARIISVITSIQFFDVIDMLLLAFIIYKGFKIVRETKAQQLIMGIIIILVLYAIASPYVLNLRVMSYLLQNFFQVGLIAIVIVFQPELRRVLERVGRANVKSVFNSGYRADNTVQNWSDAIEVIGEAVKQLSDTTTGALIVIERTNRLGEQIENGTVMDCIPSVPTLGSIFYPKTPLHDGAVVIRNARIIAAGCFLPTPQKEERINKQLGSRHRAAIGMSENSDAIIIVVSEETGTVSIAENGELTRGYTKERLIQYLRSKLIPDTGHNINITGILKSGKERKNGRRKKEEE